MISFQVLSQLHEIFFGISCWGFDFLIAICSDFDCENSSNVDRDNEYKVNLEISLESE